MSPPLRFGVVGLGFGATLMLPDLAAHAQVELVAAADPRAAAGEQFRRDYGGMMFSTAEELFAKGNLDAVYIASPSDLHAEHVLAAIETGLHVVVEKPMALTEEQCTQIQHAVRAAGVHLVCGHTHMFDAPIAAMADVVASGELGAPTHVLTLNYTDIMYRPRADWELDRTRGGGVVFMQGPHQIDIVRRVSGHDPRLVRARTVTADHERPVEGAYSAWIDLGELVATVVYSGYGYFDTSVLHHGRGERGQGRPATTHAETWQAYLSQTDPDDRRRGDGQRRDRRRLGGDRANDPPVAARSRAPDSHPFFGLTIVSCENGDVTQHPGGLTLHDRSGSSERKITVEGSPGSAVLTELCTAVADDEPPTHGADWAALTVRTCLAIHESSAMGRDIAVDAVGSDVVP